MYITSANIGDVISMNQGRSCIQIEDVTEQYVQYRNESGLRFATHDHEFEGRIVQDADRVEAFSRNFLLGSSLAQAELSAIRRLLDPKVSHEQRADAHKVLHSIRGMQQNLSARLSVSEPDKPRPRNSLESLISKANKEAQPKAKKNPGHSFNPDR